MRGGQGMGAGGGGGRGMGAGGGAGRGMGAGGGAGRGAGGGGGRGGRGGGLGLGPGGECVCPACGEKATHTRGVPCTQMKCLKCGQLMTRAV